MHIFFMQAFSTSCGSTLEAPLIGLYIADTQGFSRFSVKQTARAQRRGPYKKSEQSKERIIGAAIEQLIEEGYRSLTFRRVAQRAGVSIGNLQHHFDTKEKLIAEMIDTVITGYLDEFEVMLDSDESPTQQLTSVVTAVVEDLTTRETTMFFPELWSLANHEPAVEALMNQMYGRYIGIYERIIGRINPDLKPAQIERAALFFAASLEGHTMFLGHGKCATAVHRDIARIAVRCFLHLLEEGDIPASRRRLKYAAPKVKRPL
jgi:AcrR family transcriptional regulator